MHPHRLGSLPVLSPSCQASPGRGSGRSCQGTQGFLDPVRPLVASAQDPKPAVPTKTLPEGTGQRVHENLGVQSPTQLSPSGVVCLGFRASCSAVPGGCPAQPCLGQDLSRCLVNGGAGLAMGAQMGVQGTQIWATGTQSRKGKGPCLATLRPPGHSSLRAGPTAMPRPQPHRLPMPPVRTRLPLPCPLPYLERRSGPSRSSPPGHPQGR